MSDIIAFSNKYNLQNIKIKDLILHLQNISIFLISITSFFCCINYNFNNYFYQFENNTQPFNVLMKFITYHAFIDFFVNNSIEVKIHHVFILLLIFYNYYYNISSDDRMIILYPLIKTEISSFFFVLKYWLPENTRIHFINNLIFYIVFIKLRIYDMFYELLKNKFILEISNKYSYSDICLTSIGLTGYYGLNLLNLYWFLILTKIVYKNISKSININTDILNHYLCSYIHFLNIPLAMYIYSYNKNEKYILDVIGITSLSITSYIYHYDIYNRLKNKQINNYSIPDKENIIIFLNDAAFIQIRSFLTTATSYYYSKNFVFAISISGLCHTISFYNCIINILELFINDERKKYFLQLHNIFNGVTIAVDVILVSMNSTNEIAIAFLIVNIIAALLLVVEPFYKLTHFLLHIFLIIQNYLLCLSHSSKE